MAVNTNNETTKEVAQQQGGTVALQPAEREAVHKLMLTGNMDGLTPDQKVFYYNAMCKHLGLDPVTQPFDILKFQGKESLYAGRGCAAQLNHKHGISHKITSRGREDGLYIVVALGVLKDGRSTESTGAVDISTKKGEALANAIMKAETKAKRRATLDLVGLGVPDHSEVEDLGGQYYAFDISTGDQSEQVLFYNSIYKTAEEIENVIPKLVESKHCLLLYNANKALFEAKGNERLKEKLKAKQDEIKGGNGTVKPEADETKVEEAEVVEETTNEAQPVVEGQKEEKKGDNDKSGKSLF